jgi:hypothetical protein
MSNILHGTRGPATNGTATADTAYPGHDKGRETRPFLFGLWIRLYGVDLVTMALMGALGLSIYKARTSRHFLILFHQH